MHWFNQIRKHSPGIGLDKCLDRHARDELRAVELSHVAIRASNAHGIEGLILLLFDTDIRADARDLWSANRLVSARLS